VSHSYSIRRSHSAAEFNGTLNLITGGLGFIGSSLARGLTDLGAKVILVDSLIPD
jgi:UDP-glucose 4-epimerase